MAMFIFPVRGYGKKGITVRADLLSEAWATMRRTIPHLDALMDGEPYRIDEGREPIKPVRLGETCGMDSDGLLLHDEV